MGIRLTWVDENYGEEGHKIYRSETPMDPNSLPAALVSLGPDVAQYDDGSVVEGTTYYYRISAYLNTTELVSDEVSIEAGVFSPLVLFSNNEYGAWYDPSDLSTLFIDTSGTTPVTADGDPVGLMQDKSGNALHLTQATPSAKPTYRTNGTLHWLEFDGVDDHLVSNTLPSSIMDGGGAMVIGLQPSANDELGGAIAEECLADLYGRIIIYSDTTTTTKVAANYTPDSTSSAPVPRQINYATQLDITSHVISVNSDGTSCAGYLDGTLVNSVSATAIFPSTTQLILGRQSIGPLYTHGKVYGALLIDRAATTGEVNQIHTYIGNKSGLAI